MHRRHFLRNTGLLAGTGLFLGNSSLASFLKPFEYKVTMLRNGVGIFTERGGTIGFLITKEGALVIDSQFPDTAPHLLDEVNRQSTAPIRFLLNTHHHGDHSSGNIAFKNIAQEILAHKNADGHMRSAAEKAKTTDKQLFPTRTFDKKLKLKVGDEKLVGYYFGAAHTNGDAVYHFQNANIMHLGDLMFNKRHPFVDRTAGASMRNWITVLDKVQKKGDKDTVYIFGHSLNPGEETGNAENLKKFAGYLDKTIRFAEDAVRQGITKEVFVKNTAIPGVTEWTGNGIERPLGAAYDEVKG